MNDVVCNYAVIRFLPYVETGEFVNVGVIAHCPEVDFFDYRLVRGKTSRRASKFFPEFDKHLLTTVLRTVENELRLHRNREKLFTEVTEHNEAKIRSRMAAFAALTRRRESLVHFGEVRTKLIAGDPREEVERLFQDLVNRKFAKPAEYHEYQMTQRVNGWLRQWNLKGLYRKDHVGNDEYHFQLPFVCRVEERVVGAIKPFDLDKPTTTDIYDHGGTWVQKVKRLTKMNLRPERMVFTVELPAEQKLRGAATEICQELGGTGIEVVEFSNQQRLHELAQVPMK